MDADDARQDAALGMIEAGVASPLIGFRRAVDAVRRITHRGLAVNEPLEDRDFPDESREPWRVVYAAESLARLQRMPQAGVLADVLAGEPSTAVAARHGISKGRVSQIVADSVRRLNEG